MKQVFTILCVFCTLALQAEPVCHKCEVIREQNARRTDYYKYYDDYVKDHPEADKQQPAPKDEGAKNEVQTSKTPR